MCIQRAYYIVAQYFEIKLIKKIKDKNIAK